MAQEDRDHQHAGSRVYIPPKYQKIRLYYSVDELTLARIKHFHIWPSAVIRAALAKEIRRRLQEERHVKRRQLVNRFSGEVLLEKRPRRK